MLTLSNVLTILRFPAAFLFLIDSVPVRLAAIVIAMLSDSFDGYIARRQKTVSQLGAVLDPVMDKFFVFFALGILVAQGQVQIWEMAAIISRDFFLCFFALYLSLTKTWDKVEFKSVIWGKLTTAAQFILLIALVLNFVIPWYTYTGFVIFGFLTVFSFFREFRFSEED